MKLIDYGEYNFYELETTSGRKYSWNNLDKYNSCIDDY